MDSMDDFWSMSEAVFACLHDTKRTLAFRKAIRKTVKKGDVVVDFGAGTGILSMFAADAGAKKVYAVELDKGNFIPLKKTIKQNGYTDVISVIEGDATNVTIPEQVDVIICEMIATGLIDELQVPVMNNAHRFAKPTTKVLLQQYSIFAELVTSKTNFYNKTFDIIRYELPEMRDMRSKSLTSRMHIKTIDFAHAVKDQKIKEKRSVITTNSGTINGLKITGVTLFSDGSTFHNSTSYSFPIILPISPFEVRKNEKVDVSIDYTLCGGPSSLKYAVVKALS